jgi:hypothetical protein
MSCNGHVLTCHVCSYSLGYTCRDSYHRGGEARAAETEAPRKADEEAARGLGGGALGQLEHVAAGLADRSHLGDHRKVVDHEADLSLLVPGEGLGVALGKVGEVTLASHDKDIVPRGHSL